MSFMLIDIVMRNLIQITIITLKISISLNDFKGKIQQRFIIPYFCDYSEI